MGQLKLDLWTCDVGAPAGSPVEFAELIISRILQSWDSGADIVVFPEFTWMGLERFVATEDKLAGVSLLFWDQLWPDLQARLSRPDKAVVLGTVPFAIGNGTFKNRAPILSEGSFLFQDKIHLTPWENRFEGGGPLRIWKFKNYKIATVICLDVEIPEISSALRGSSLDLMLVPSATENLMGVERVGRCADARSVEIGCHVGLCHLVGKSDSILVDENIGTLSAFSPSQSLFSGQRRQQAGQLITTGFHRKSVELDMLSLARIRTLKEETNPANVLSRAIQIAEN